MTRLARYLVAFLFALTGIAVLLVDVHYAHTVHVTNLLGAMLCWFVAGLLCDLADALQTLAAVASALGGFLGKGAA